MCASRSQPPAAWRSAGREMRPPRLQMWLVAAISSLLSAERAAAVRGTARAQRLTHPRTRPVCTISEPRASFELNSLEAQYRQRRRSGALYPHKVEVLQQLEPFVEQHLGILKSVEDSWQPQDFLPDMGREDWREQVAELQAECAGIPDGLLVAIVGDTVTEEALPTYQTLLNTFEGMDDPTGVSQSPWCRWSRGWTAEENRHGDLLNKFLYLSGRIDMRAMEVTVQRLIRDGFNPGGQKDPYRGIIYTSFQERATKISHQNVAKLCGDVGARRLGMLTTRIAGDEARHEMAYQTFMKEIFRLDPSGAMLSFGDMMRNQIAMPAELMTDGKNEALFTDFTSVAQSLGVYTAMDYACIVDYLVKEFDIEHVEGLTPDAKEVQEMLCALAPRYMKLAERSMKSLPQLNDDELHGKFSWLKPRL